MKELTAAEFIPYPQTLLPETAVKVAENVDSGYFNLVPIEEFQARIYRQKQQMEIRLAKGHFG